MEFLRLKASETEEKNKVKELEDTQVWKEHYVHLNILWMVHHTPGKFIAVVQHASWNSTLFQTKTQLVIFPPLLSAVIVLTQ